MRARTARSRRASSRLLRRRRRPQRAPRPPADRPPTSFVRDLEGHEQHPRELAADVAGLPGLAGDGHRVDVADRRRFQRRQPASTGTVLQLDAQRREVRGRARPPVPAPSSRSMICPGQPLVRTGPSGTGSPSPSAITRPAWLPTSARACAQQRLARSRHAIRGEDARIRGCSSVVRRHPGPDARGEVGQRAAERVGPPVAVAIDDGGDALEEEVELVAVERGEHRAEPAPQAPRRRRRRRW